MANWVTLTTVNLDNSRGTVGYVRIQYDSAGKDGQKWPVRIYADSKSGSSYNVNFTNGSIDGNSFSVNGVTAGTTVWSGKLTATSARTISGQWTCPWYSQYGGSRKYTFSTTLPVAPPDVVKPSGVTVSSISTPTYNSVKGTYAVSNWGGETSGSRKYIAALVYDSSSGGARRENSTTNSSSFTTTVTNSSTAFDGGITMKGAGQYWAEAYASNSAGGTYSGRSSLYTQPADLASVTYTQTQGSTNVTVGITITGGSSSVNNSNAVTTYWRYSTNGGSSYSNWTAISGTATAWTAKTASFTCDYGASVKIQAKQQYQSKDSAVKEVSFTATTGTAPSGGTLAVASKTWNSITLTAAGVNYGKPDGISGRKLAIGVHAYNDNTTKRENQVENVTGATTTVNNSSVYPSGTALQLKGMAAVYPYIWAWNTKTSTYVVNQTTAEYLPPAPGQISYQVVAETAASNTYEIVFTGIVGDNVTDYTAADLVRTVRYRINSGQWIYQEESVQKAIDADTTITVTLSPGEQVEVGGWMNYKGISGEAISAFIINSDDPIFIYGSVNGETKLIEHIYAPVNGDTKKIKKVYASVGGISRKVFEDGS